MNSPSETWFRRFADVPGTNYQTPPQLQSVQLPGSEAIPQLRTSQIQGQPYTSLVWGSSTGNFFLSPAAAWKPMAHPGETAVQLALRTLTEALELPGTLHDYHYQIQACCNVLWNHRRDEPGAILELERLYLLDLQLIEAHPAMLVTSDQPPRQLAVDAWWRLVYFYEREGYLPEALEIAERSARLNAGSMPQDIERLRNRIAQLEECHEQ